MKINSNLFKAFVCIISVGIILSCNRKGGNSPEPTEEKDSTDAKPLYLNQLILSGAQFDSLKAVKGNLLVFQFFYPASKSCQSPTLYAYAMVKGKKEFGKNPAQLSYDSISTEPFTGRAQVLGDQQLKVSDLDKLLKQLSEKYKGKDYHFHFTPIFYSGNPHITYEVQARGGGAASGTMRTNPSPPAHGLPE